MFIPRSYRNNCKLHHKMHIKLALVYFQLLSIGHNSKKLKELTRYHKAQCNTYLQSQAKFRGGDDKNTIE